MKCDSFKNGFTFLEVMVALSVLALVITAVFKLHIQSVSMIIATDFYLKAPLLAEEIITEKKYGNDVNLNDQGTFENYPDFKWTTSEIEVNINDYTDEASPEIKNIKFRKVKVIISMENGRNYNTFFYTDEKN